MLVSEIGEEGLLRLLAERLPRSSEEVWAGDDTAVLAPISGRSLFTTDTLVEEVDFSLAYFTGADVGRKTVAVNVSDVAAMGGRPGKALTTLCLPPTTELAFVEGLLDGLVEAATAYGLDLVGGDISSSPVITSGIALTGVVDGDPWLRSGANPGDGLFVTGSLGGSHTGLQQLRADPHASGPAVERHLRPRARLAESAALRAVPVSAAIDVSDGLVVDLARLMRASATGCEVDPTAIPIDASAPGVEPALFGGEDFELLLAIEAASAEQAVAAVEGCGTTLTQIGVVTEGRATLGGIALEEMKEKMWDHLRNR